MTAATHGGPYLCGWEMAVVDRVTDTARPGQIVLLHVGPHPTDRSTLDADALPEIIEQLEAQGYWFIALTEALTIAGD